MTPIEDSEVKHRALGVTPLEAILVSDGTAAAQGKHSTAAQVTTGAPYLATGAKYRATCLARLPLVRLVGGSWGSS